MDILSKVCSIGAALIDFIVMILTAQYIYYEKLYRHKKAVIILSMSAGLIMIILEICNFGDFTILIGIGTLSIMIFLSREKRRIRGLFLFIPIIGIILSLWFIILIIASFILKSNLSEVLDNSICSLISSLVTVIIIVGYIKLQHYWVRKNFRNIDIDFREFELSSVQRNIISWNGFLLLVVFCLLINIDNMENIEPYKIGITILVMLFSILMLSTIIMMIMKAMSSNCYRYISQINEHYLQAQLNHFKAYRKSQIETRRIRHDMKNHFLCMCDLYDNKNFEKLGEYIHELNNTVMGINKELYIGNDIADAIINEKNETAKSLGIEIHTEGSLNGIDNIAPIDICTIFANALDNSIEALKSYKLQKPIINISVRKNKNFTLISFINPVYESTIHFNGSKYKTSKKDKRNHGFGLENMELTARKYNGYVNTSIIDYEDMGKVFATEVILKV